MKGLDLSKLKKVSSDDKMSVFRHPAGHEIKIAHSMLSPKLRQDLEALPTHKADGGDVNSSQQEQDSPDKIASDASKQPPPVVINVGGPQPSSEAQAYGKAYGVDPHIQPQQPIAPPEDSQGNAYAQAYNNSLPQQLAPDNSAPPEQPQAQQEPAQAPQSQPQAPEPAAPAPQAPQAVSPQQLQAVPQNPVKTELSNEASAYERDLNNGHITPETYQSLYAKKDTLGKVGSLFGMLLSGAGSGLAHQPNALLGLMQNQIDNDLKAQMQSKTNAQNFYHLNQQNEMNKAQVGGVNIDTKTKAFALAQSQMLQSSYHDLVQRVNAMPEGQQKEQAKQMLGVMYQGVQGKINDINDQAAGAQAYQQMLFGNAPGGDGEQQLQRQTQILKSGALGPQGIERGKDIESKHIPGFSGMASESMDPKTKGELKKAAQLDHQLSDYMDFTKAHSGSLDPRIINEGHAMAIQLQSAYREAALNTVYRPGEQGLLDKVIPKDPTAFAASWRVTPQLQAIKDTNLSNLNQAAKLEGLGKYKGFGNEGSSQPSPSETKTMNGIPYKMGADGNYHRVK